MPKLPDSLQQWPSASFSDTLKRELESLPTASLPLEKGTTRCGIVDDSNIAVTVINVTQNNTHIQAKIGVFFTEIVAGCVCGEDPAPENAYCELRINIEKASAEANFEIIQP